MIWFGKRFDGIIGAEVQDCGSSELTETIKSTRAKTSITLKSRHVWTASSRSVEPHVSLFLRSALSLSTCTLKKNMYIYSTIQELLGNITHLLHSCGQFQTELNDLILGRGEITDACEGSPTRQTKRHDSCKHSWGFNVCQFWNAFQVQTWAARIRTCTFVCQLSVFVKVFWLNRSQNTSYRDSCQ